MNPILDLSPRLQLLPVVYGCGDFALEVRRRMARQEWDCLAVCLPPSFADPLETAVGYLPRITLVVQAETAPEPCYNFVPVDPCQPVIAALRSALENQIERAYIDQEVQVYQEEGFVLPDGYGLRQVPLERFMAALLPSLEAPKAASQRQERIRRMAFELHLLELEYRRILCVCAAADWPWLRQAYQQRLPYPEHEPAAMPQVEGVGEEHLYFVLGELPFITHLYEHRRAELMADTSMAIDGVKALLIEARANWEHELELEDHWLTPQRLAILLQYVRNLTLLDSRMTPDLYNLALAAKQVVGDSYALSLIQTAQDYPPQRMPSPLEPRAVGPGKLVDLDGEVRLCKNRLQGVPLEWRQLPLKPDPPPPRQQRWRLQWNPFGQCSYLPEDRRIETFQQHVRDQAKALIGNELARTEKFSASLKDGIDIRETLRNWHTGELYVREVPPVRGNVEVVVFLFETGAVAQRFSWRSTWYAEHPEESTLSFFATPFNDKIVGPGIGQSIYGGCFFLFPPRPIADIWQDASFDFARSPEERLLAGALFHSLEKRVVLVAPKPPGSRWRRLARRYKKQIVYLPLGRFSPSTIDRLRRFHVLEGKQVRSYASRFIRDLR